MPSFFQMRFLFVAALAVSMPCCVQSSSRPDTNPNRAFVAHNVGKAYINVDGLWAFHPGDNPGWASPSFNDSAWPRIETGETWEEQGFRNLTGFAWYRRRIVLDSQTDPNWKLALYLPGIENAAEIFWNGRRVGSFGKLPPDPEWYTPDWTSDVVLLCLECGRGQIVLGRPQSGVLAIRVWAAPYVFFSSPAVGGLTTTPQIGSLGAIRDEVGRQSAVWLKSSLYGLGLVLVEGIVALLALLAWLRDRKRWMLFWLAVYAAHAVLLLPFDLPGLLSFRWSYGLIALVVGVEDISLWFLLLYLLCLREDRRLVRWTKWVTAVAIVGNFGDGALQLFHWTTWPAHVFLAWDMGLTIPALLVEVWVLVLVAFALRRKLDTARWLLAIAATLVEIVQAISDWGGAGARWTHWTAASAISRPLFTVAGNAFTPSGLADTLLLVAILYAAWRYEAEQRERQSRLDEEFRNAQELQQLLVPESLPVLPGYSVSSVYKPAMEVGGDFFQVIPCALPANAALLVVGDVSGKGLKAAMTVSLIVGALRAFAEAIGDPAALLAALNRRLHERLRGGFCTCVVMRINPDGTCLVASAGHLSPYRNGEELPLDSSLPLGIAPDAIYSETTLHLAPNDQLTFLSDGIVEAQSATGELFGFDRTRAISTKSADEIARAAQAHGQQDDITVLTLRFNPVEVVHGQAFAL